MKGKGLYIAAGVVLVLALVCLFTGEIQAFGGGVVIAAALAAYGQWKKGHPETSELRTIEGREGSKTIRETVSYSLVFPVRKTTGFHPQQAVPGWPLVWRMERKGTPRCGAVGPL